MVCACQPLHEPRHHAADSPHRDMSILIARPENSDAPPVAVPFRLVVSGPAVREFFRASLYRLADERREALTRNAP